MIERTKNRRDFYEEWHSRFYGSEWTISFLLSKFLSKMSSMKKCARFKNRLRHIFAEKMTMSELYKTFLSIRNHSYCSRRSTCMHFLPPIELNCFDLLAQEKRVSSQGGMENYELIGLKDSSFKGVCAPSLSPLFYVKSRSFFHFCSFDDAP